MTSFQVAGFFLFCLAMLAWLVFLIFDAPVVDDAPWQDGDTTGYGDNDASR